MRSLPPRSWLPIGVLTLLALALRLWGLGFGAPGIAHDDEWQYVAVGTTLLERGTVRVATTTEAPYRNPTGFVFASAAASAPVDAVLRSGASPLDGPRARYRAHRVAYHLATRLLSALLGTLSVVLLYRLARTQVGPRAALLGAALLAFAPLHVRDSHFATNDVALCLLVIVAFDAAVRLRIGGPPSARRLLLSGSALGAACAVKYSAGLLAPALFVLIAARLDARRPAADAGRALVLYLLGAALAFLVLFPAALLEPGRVVASFLEQAEFGSRPWPGQAPGSSPALTLQHLGAGLGALGLLAGALGLCVLASRRARLTIYPALHVLAFVPMPLVFARLDLPLLPFLCLGAAVLAQALGAGSGRRTAACLAVLLLAQPIAASVRIDAVLAQPDTRVELTQRLELELAAHVTEPTRVALDAGALRYLPVDRRGQWDERLRPTLLTPGKCARCRREVYVAAEATATCRNAVCPRRGVRVPIPSASEALKTISASAALVVTTSFYFEGETWHRALGAELERSAERVLTIQPGWAIPYTHEDRYGPLIHPWRRTRPGPEIRIYRLR